MDYERALGFYASTDHQALDQRRSELRRYINLKLAANGFPIIPTAGSADIVSLASGLLANFEQRTRLLEDYRCPVDTRIENFLNGYFKDLVGDNVLRLPGRSVILDRHGMARELSLPADGDEYLNDLVSSYRVRNGVLHNPKHDKRTTAGTFHICGGGLPVGMDKREVPRQAYVNLFRAAVNPPAEILELPFTSRLSEPTNCWVSLQLRPVLRPAVPGYCSELSMECRFFAPASLVSNLDFVESIFGNAGDPFLPENDAGFDVEHWSGHTGCVILAPHLIKLTKKELGLPHVDQATERQRRDGMCWSDAGELYNDGNAFKCTCRNEQGVVVTLIADNYFGYCKKEVKTQLSYAANLFGGVEEEHAGGAVVFPSWSLGDEFQFDSRRYNGRTIDDVFRDYGSAIDIRPEGYGIDRQFPDLIYIPENGKADLREQCIRWDRNGQVHSIPLRPGKVYMAPSGYKLRMEKHPAAPTWRLIGTAGEGTFCHKPCTVSGGGKSEISKSIVDYMQYGPIFVSDIEEDLNWIEKLLQRDYSQRWTSALLARQNYQQFPSRPILSTRRSLGSVIKLLTPSDEYCDEYNAWLQTIPNHIYALLFIIKRFYQPEWGDDWRLHFSVDIVNGSPGHELKLHDRKLVGTYLRVGLEGNHGWRTFKIRQDFAAAAKLQTEDDISVSVTVPRHTLNHLAEGFSSDSVKLVQNCEYRLFQRPDDAINRGLDKQAEADLARRDVNFISNFEPLTRAQVQEMLDKVIDFDAFTAPMQELLRSVDKGESGYIVCSANPRRVGGVPTKNPRYLQDRPDLVKPMDRYVAEMGMRLFRGIPAGEPVHIPVTAVLSGRRNNPPEPEKGIRGLAVYNPIHYQELPELFMDYICSLTGKSPSTTGAGSEGALTKGPFNMLRPAADLNSALVAMILNGHTGFSTAAGHIGPRYRCEHDISYLVPEVWCRMAPDERSPEWLIEQECLERVPQVSDAAGQPIKSSRLGFRITRRFVRRYFGRIFDNPDKVFDEGILRPETQDMGAFIDGIRHICESHQKVARQYIQDGTIEELCPPLQALVTIMAEGSWRGLSESDPEFRDMFTRKSLLASAWYAERLRTKQEIDVSRWRKHVDYLNRSLEHRVGLSDAQLGTLTQQVEIAHRKLQHAQSDDYLRQLQGTIGATRLPTSH